jgi:hypothetical protein
MLFAGLRPLLQLIALPSASLRPLLHDGYISALRAYSPSALQALGRAADPAMRIEFLPRARRLGPKSIGVVFSRPGVAMHPRKHITRGLSGNDETDPWAD